MAGIFFFFFLMTECRLVVAITVKKKKCLCKSIVPTAKTGNSGSIRVALAAAALSCSGSGRRKAFISAAEAVI